MMRTRASFSAFLSFYLLLVAFGLLLIGAVGCGATRGSPADPDGGAVGDDDDDDQPGDDDDDDDDMSGDDDDDDMSGDDDDDDDPLSSAACDDGNACTVDILLADGSCANDPRPDGARCEDGSFCTLGDRCLAGVCAPGTAAVGPLAELGRAEAFGTLRGSAEIVGDDRILFLDSPGVGSDLTVVDVAADRLDVVHRRHDPELPFFDHRDLPRANLGGGLIVFSEDRIFERRLVVVEVTPDGTSRVRSRLLLDASLGQVTSMAAVGTDVWVCANNFLASASVFRFDLSDPDAPRSTGGLALGERGCGSIGGNADGSRLYVNTTSGVRWLDLSSEPPVLQPDIVSGDAQPRVVGDKLYLKSDDRVVVLRESNFAELVEIRAPIDGAHPTTDDLLWVQGIRPRAGGTEAYVALIDPFSAGGPETLDEVVIAGFGPGVDDAHTTLIANDDLLVQSYTKRVFRRDGEDLVELRHPALGEVGRVAGRGPDAVARSRFTAHRLDVSDPADPVWTAGGPHGADPAITLESADPPLLLDSRNPSFFDPPWVVELPSHWGATAEVVWRGYDPDERPADLATFTMETGGYLHLADTGLYRLDPRASAVEATLERWDLAPLEVGGDVALASSIELAPDPPIALGADRSPVANVAVDPRARLAVVALGSYRAFDDQEAALFVVDLVAGDVEELADRLDHVVQSVLISGDRIVYRRAGDLVFVERGAGEVARARAVDESVDELLAFDGDVAYVALWPDRSLAAVAWGATDLAGVDRVPFHAHPTTLTVTDGALVAASPTEVATVHPACP